MKGRPRWLDLLTCGLVLGIALPVAYLPLRISYPLGEALGRLAFFWDRRHRRVVCENLLLAFGRSRTPDEVMQMARSHFRCLGKTFVDMCRLVRLSPGALKEVVEIDGLEPLTSARARGQGVLFVTGHFGPWEYLPALSTHLTGEALTVVVRPLDNPYLDRFLNAIRARWGGRVVEKRAAMRVILGVLHRGGNVGILIDQHVSRGEGVFVDFFGHPACTTSAPALLALRSKAAIIPAVILREGRGRFRLLLGKEVSAPRTGDVRKDVVALTAAMTAALEELIRNRPEEWFWVHRRWKHLAEGTNQRKT
ncbi:MAG: lysophospholipid acyltransferase family protein [Candidatus Methylomirabilales bacterium]